MKLLDKYDSAYNLGSHIITFPCTTRADYD